MDTYGYFIGIDVSKSTLDIPFGAEKGVFKHKTIQNNRSGISRFFEYLSKEVSKKDILICLENTGRYMNVLLRYLSSNGYAVWVENALSIKRSLGLQRGKNDQVDAFRIAEYACRFVDKARFYLPASPSLEKLRLLENSRKQLVKIRQALRIELKESASTEEISLYQLKEKIYQQTLEALDKDIEHIDEEIEQVFKEDEELQRMQLVLCSVPGLGKVTATCLLIVTQGFSKFESAKKLACYCGVVPFEHRSGTSVRGKTRVSNYANKTIKSLLFLCARAAIRTETDLKTYYERKLKEGKRKMSVLNAIQNKIIHRAFALIKQDRMYQKNYQHLLA